MQPKDTWSLIAHRKGELTIKYEARDFCRWRSVIAPKSAAHISSVWHGIECTNFLIDHAFRSICGLNDYVLANDKEALKQEQMWIHVLESLSFSMYRDLHIICKVIEEYEEAEPVFQSLSDSKEYRQLERRIIEIRNWLVEHRDKPNFYTQLAHAWSTAASGTDLRIQVQPPKRKKDDRQPEPKTIQLQPLTDAETMRNFLNLVFSS